MAIEYQTPDFLQGGSADEIHQRMIAALPRDFDVSEGSHEWNMTRPTALVVAMLYEFVLPEVVKLIFPSWSYGDYLELHAAQRGMIRRAATAATGTITISGEVGAIIPKDSSFSTASVNNAPSVEYLTTIDATIPASGSVDVGVICNRTGPSGNTPAATVIFPAGNVGGISAVTNREAITGGTLAESDEALILRIEEYDATQDQSFVGNVSDYKRWAMSVSGVGEAVVIPAQDDSGLVTIVLTDANGDPANETLRNAVYDYIMRPDDPYTRLAPVGARLTVAAPATLAIGIQAVIELAEGHALETVKQEVLKNLAQYLQTAMDEQEVKFSRVGRVLSETEGVNDYSDLQIGVRTAGGTDYGVVNLPIGITELPTIAADDLVLTSGTV
ncbi:MAG: baseplate J/gp47 family protein [Peptococcaceae bacterium]|nr:baseplate J/gp47 family protein [Peptococcaceae bacterium]